MRQAGQDVGCEASSSFVRDGVVTGLGVAAKWGVNPFKYGFIGASDNHTGTPGGVPEQDLLQKRKKLMADWAEFCATPWVERGDNVIDIRSA